MNILDSGILCHKRPEKGGGGQNKLQRFSDGLIRVCGRIELRRAAGGFVVNVLVVPRIANQLGGGIAPLPYEAQAFGQGGAGPVMYRNL